jgi:hypothetical protein
VFSVRCGHWLVWRHFRLGRSGARLATHNPKLCVWPARPNTSLSLSLSLSSSLFLSLHSLSLSSLCPSSTLVSKHHKHKTPQIESLDPVLDHFSARQSDRGRLALRSPSPTNTTTAPNNNTTTTTPPQHQPHIFVSIATVNNRTSQHQHPPLNTVVGRPGRLVYAYVLAGPTLFFLSTFKPKQHDQHTLFGSLSFLAFSRRFVRLFARFTHAAPSAHPHLTHPSSPDPLSPQSVVHFSLHCRSLCPHLLGTVQHAFSNVNIRISIHSARSCSAYPAFAAPPIHLHFNASFSCSQLFKSPFFHVALGRRYVLVAPHSILSLLSLSSLICLH